jgi:hypothetical protein
MSTVNETQSTSTTLPERKSCRSLGISLDAQAGVVTEQGQHCHACIVCGYGALSSGRVDVCSYFKTAVESPSTAFFIM